MRGIVRRRCMHFISILKDYGYDFEVPLKDARELFQMTLNIMDRTSLSAYFGTQATRSIRKMQRIARYATGTTSFKGIEISQDIPSKKGYFEILGMATFELRGKTWFMILNREPLVPEIVSQHKEDHACEESIKDFSLSPFLQGKECEKTDLEVVSLNDKETMENKQTTTYRSRERKLYASEHITYALSPEESAILNAKRVDSEPDRAKVSWAEEKTTVVKRRV